MALENNRYEYYNEGRENLKQKLNIREAVYGRICGKKKEVAQ